MNLLLIFLGIVSLVALYTEAVMTPVDRQDMIGQFPFLTYLSATYTPEGGGNPVTVYGAGSLVNPLTVVTSAYLLYGASKGTAVTLTVSVGLTDPAKISQNTNTFTLDETAIEIDENYNPSVGYSHNAAVVILPREVTDVTPAILVVEGMTIARNECYVAGYGAYKPNGQYPNPVKIAPLPLLCKPGERTKCIQRNNALTGQIFPEANFDYCSVASGILCAGYFQSPTYIGPCSSDAPGIDGDNGDPVVCNLKNNRGKTTGAVLVGFVYGDSCVNDPKVPLGPSERVPAIIGSVLFESHLINKPRLSECDKFFL